MSPHFGPSDRDRAFSAFDLSGLTHSGQMFRLVPRAEAEARFFAHIALSNLPHNASNVAEAKTRYGQFLANIFEHADAEDHDFDCEIIASCCTAERDVLLTSLRQRSTGDLILPRPDDVLKLDPTRLLTNARHFEEDTFCGILFDIRPQGQNYLVEATPVLLPRLMRREAIRLHNGDPDSLVGELISRFARRELGNDLRFTSALVADDELDEGLTLLLRDHRDREYATKIVNPGGGLLHEIEFFIPLSSSLQPPGRGIARSIDLGEAFRRRHERLEYAVLASDAIPVHVRSTVESHLRSTLSGCWQRDWRISYHGAAVSREEETHYHLFVAIEDRNRLRVIPSFSGEATVHSRKLGGLLVHVDETPQGGFVSSLKAAIGLARGSKLAPKVEALMIHPRVVAAEIERLVSRPGESIFAERCRSAIELDLDKRGKSAPLDTITYGPFAGWSHPSSKVPLRAVIANHRHGRHLLSIALDERYGVLHPDSDIRVEGFFPK